MNPESESDAPAVEQLPALTEPKKKPVLLEFPGLVAIGLYMILNAGIIVLYVVHGTVGPLYLFFSAMFITGAMGLMMLLRWAWAMTLAGVAILAGMYLWGFSVQHSYPNLMQGLLNLVFFLYLIRTELRERLR